MTQQPPQQPPQPPESDMQHAAPLWQDQRQIQPQYPVYPPVVAQAVAEPGLASLTQPGTPQLAKPRRLGELAVIAVIAAILASAGTYVVTRNDVTHSPMAQSAVSAPPPRRRLLQASTSAPNWSAVAAVVSPSVVSITVTGSQGGGRVLVSSSTPRVTS